MGRKARGGQRRQVDRRQRKEAAGAECCFQGEMKLRGLKCFLLLVHIKRTMQQRVSWDP